ncbi:DUF2141 domain-containing protein [Pseudoroseomonas wenyumeiae]
MPRLKKQRGRRVLPAVNIVSPAPEDEGGGGGSGVAGLCCSPCWPWRRWRRPRGGTGGGDLRRTWRPVGAADRGGGHRRAQGGGQHDHHALWQPARGLPGPQRQAGPAARADARRAGGGLLRRLHPGIYAVAVYHDENNDHDFNRTLLGMPAEGYGFSNDAPTVIGLPSFESVRFQVGPEGARVPIRLRY